MTAHPKKSSEPTKSWSKTSSNRSAASPSVGAWYLDRLPQAANVITTAADAASSARRGGTLGSGAFFARDATRALAQLLGIGGGGAAESVGARAARRGWARVLVPLLLSFADAAAVDSDAKVRLNLSGRLFATQ